MLYTSNDQIISTINSMNISISSLQFVNANRDEWNDETISPFNRIYFVLEGEGHLKYSDKNITIKPGFVYLIPTGLKFHYSCDNYVNKLYAHFNILLPNGYDYFSNLKEIRSFNLGIELIKKIIDIYVSGNNTTSLFIKSALYYSVYQIINNCNYENNYNYSRLVLNTMNIIKENLSIKLTVEDLSKECFVTSTTLSSYYKKELGTTVKQYIDNLIYFNIQRDLLESKLSMSEIAEKYGFCDQFHLSRRFRQRLGITPTAFRKKLSSISAK